MAAVTAVSASAAVNAEEGDNFAWIADTSKAIGSVDSEGYVLISEERYADGDFFIVDRQYEYSEISTYANDTGKKDVKRSRSIYGGNSFTDLGNLLAIMWVSGTFQWDKNQDTATVSNVKAWIDHYEGSDFEVTAKSGYPKSGSNQGSNSSGRRFGKKIRIHRILYNY